jgi:hypothetical protein
VIGQLIRHITFFANSFHDFGETTTAVVMLSETIGLAVAITHLMLLIKTYTIVSMAFPKVGNKLIIKRKKRAAQACM